MKSKIKSFVVGVVCGGLLLGSVGYATDTFQIDVTLPNISYLYDDKELSLGQVEPQTIMYDGVNYVPVRGIAEALGKEVTWDESDNKVLIHNMKQLTFANVEPEEMSAEIEAWVEQSTNEASTLLKTNRGATYILLTLGKRESGGYAVNVTDIKQYHDGITVLYDLTEPDKGTLVTEAITYPYQLVKISGEYKGPVKSIENETNKE